MLRFFKKNNKPEATTEAPTADTPPIPAPIPEAPAAEKPAGWMSRLSGGLTRTREQLGQRLTGLLRRGGKIDEALYEELETVLLTSDVGVKATQFLLDQLRDKVRRERIEDAAELQNALRKILTDLLQPLEKPLQPTSRPYVVMLAGVNGAGKTTSIGKLAKHFQARGLSVLLAAGDTFRAAAREQLAVWGERNNVAVVAQEGNDAAAVIFDAVNAARARGMDVVIADTAGRLPTQLHLMEELKKIQRVIKKADGQAPHEVLLVLDANTGQNALAQVSAFDDALKLTGLIVTKLDGTAKGGVIAAIAREKPIPVRFIGVGEGLDDLQPFAAAQFVEALFSGPQSR